MKNECDNATREQLIAKGHALLDKIESQLRFIIESAKNKSKKAA